MDNNNNNNCTTNYEDVKDKDFILELLCWHNEFRRVFLPTLASDPINAAAAGW